MHYRSPTYQHHPFLLPIKTSLDKRKSFSNPLSGFTFFIVAHYSWITLFVGVAFIILETLSHLSLIHKTNLYFSIEMLMIVGILGSSLVLVNKLLASLSETVLANQSLQIKNDFNASMSVSQSLEGLSKCIVQKSARIVPGTKIALYIRDSDKNFLTRMDTAAEDGSLLNSFGDEWIARIDTRTCRKCIALSASAECQAHFCVSGVHGAPKSMTGCYCMPLVYNTQLVGLLRFEASHPSADFENQIALLESARPEISSAIHTALTHHKREENHLAQKVRDVQQEIARNMHDTIGQNISYLRMRLNFLVEHGGLDGPDTARDLMNMFNAAKESYDLVRGTMAILQSNDSLDLEQLFRKYAAQVAERSNFEVIFNTIGQHQSITAGPMLQLFLVFREALSNIEKHACASKVNISMDWDKEKLSMSISDDGCGFDPYREHNDHYGLRNMQERISRINGTLHILSKVGSGATIQAQVPYI